MGLAQAKQVTGDNGEVYYNPSSLAMKVAYASKSKYSKETYEQTYSGDKPTILVVCTDDGKMKMKNGKVFNSGNHPIETLVPMLHLRDAGYTNFEFATETGGAVVFEMWAFPSKDDNVKELYESLKTGMDNPKKISDISSLDNYSAIFIPGGHGAMINLPKSKALGTLLHMAHEQKFPTITLCHGPAALLSTGEVEGKDFAYDGYETCCFTDKTDSKTPSIGYLPGHMPWKCQEALEKVGMKVQNRSENGTVHQYEELITGDSPTAADNLGRFAAKILLGLNKE